MYVGRIVAIGMNKIGNPSIMYRVSSRSFPNRETRKIGDDKIAVMAKPGYEENSVENPYITYNCIRITGEHAIAGNGSHTDTIAEKIQMGVPVRDAVALSLLVLDYEKDDYNTPRIAAVINHQAKVALLATVKYDALVVRNFELLPGTASYLATYEHDMPSVDLVDKSFDARSAREAANYIFDQGVFSSLQNPVASAAAYFNGSSFEV